MYQLFDGVSLKADMFVCQNCTLDQVSLCTPGRLNDVAPRPAPPALRADSPDPEAPLSLLSLLSLILLWSLSSLACPLLRMTCWPAPQPQPPPCHRSSEVQFSPHRITSPSCVCSGRQLHQIEHVSPVGGGECFPALGAARPASGKTQWCSLCYYHPRENRSPLWGGQIACFFERQIDCT